MGKAKTRTQFFDSIGADYSNRRWSWCAVSHLTKTVYFGAWDSKWVGNTAVILDDDWEVLNGRRQPGFSDALKKIGLVENEKYELEIFRMLGSSENPEKASVIREIDETLFAATLKKEGQKWLAEIK